MSYRILFEEIKRRAGFETDAEFADGINVSRITINSVLNGKAPSYKIVAAALHVLKMDLGDLQLPSEDPAIEEEKTILRLFRNLKDAQLRQDAQAVLKAFGIAQKQLTGTMLKRTRK